VTGLSSGVKAITAGSYHTCALTTAGSVLCWGNNESGELGNNSTTNSLVPVAVTGLSAGVSAIAAGGAHTCALTGGGVQCWGNNNNGQLGNSSRTDSHVPVAVTGLSSGVSAIAAGSIQTCALTTAGGVQCWGYTGEESSTTGTVSVAPAAVMGLSSEVLAISASYSHACALTTAGGVECWGGDQYDELGNNSTTTSFVAVDATELSFPVSAVAVGVYCTCVLTTEGGVQCWGFNFSGQLGVSSGIDSSVPVTAPVTVTGLSSGISAIFAGSQNMCALTVAGTVKCWGSNTNGELGDGSFYGSLPGPVDVVAP